jgi:hypothetical protein
VLTAPRGVLRGAVDDTRVTGGGRTVTLGNAPISIGGEVYVPLDYFGRAADMGVAWNRQDRRLDLYTDRSARVLGTRQTRNLPRVTPAQLVSNLAAVDYERLRASAPAYRVIDVAEVFTPEQVSRLRTLINENATARRQRNLLTDFLRDTERITNQQTVVGISEADRVIWVQ